MPRVLQRQSCQTASTVQSFVMCPMGQELIDQRYPDCRKCIYCIEPYGRATCHPRNQDATHRSPRNEGSYSNSIRALSYNGDQQPSTSSRFRLCEVTSTAFDSSRFDSSSRSHAPRCVQPCFPPNVLSPRAHSCEFLLFFCFNHYQSCTDHDFRDFAAMPIPSQAAHTMPTVSKSQYCQTRRNLLTRAVRTTSTQ
jgi:hypothetical protein